MTQENDKFYTSYFVPEHKIDIANYLTEILIKNFLEWQKIPKPNCPFWRKEVSSNNPALKKLANKYIAELTEIKRLLHVFDASILAEDFIKNKRIGIKIIKKEFREKILLSLLEQQINRNVSNTKIINIEPISTEHRSAPISLGKSNKSINI